MEGLRIALLFLGSFLVGMMTRGIVRQEIPLTADASETFHMAADMLLLADTSSVYTFKDTKQVPTLKVRSSADTQGGVNIQLTTSRFTFAPQYIGKTKGLTYGYATYTINGKQMGRLYHYRLYIAPSQLTSGINVVTISLYTTDHQQLAKPNGSAVTETLFITIP